MSDDVKALIAEAREWARANINERRLINELADALEAAQFDRPCKCAQVSNSAQTEAAHAEPDENERLVRAVIDAWTVEGVSPAYHRDMQKSLATNWPRLQQAIVALVRGGRRPSRVPVSRDELARFIGQWMADDHAGFGSCNAPRNLASDILAVHDIYPKADRKPADSGETAQ